MDPTLVGVATTGVLAGMGLGWTWGWRKSRRRNQRFGLELADARDRYDEARRQQHAQTDLFRTLFQAAPECIKLHGADGRVQRINAAGLVLLETDQPARIVGKSVFGVVAPEYHQAYRDLTARVFDGGSGCMEFELITFQGRRRWLETHAVPLRDTSGTIMSLLAVTRDIDERKRMARLLDDQRGRLQTIIESEPECVKLQDQDGVIIEMNPAGLALLNAQRPEQIIGRSVYEFVNEPYRPAYRELTAGVFAGERRSMEFEVTGIYGRPRWLETHATPLRDGGGEVTALLAITRDIEERKQNEAKLRRQHEELAHVSRLSTLGELASGLAHELNQPLCAISSYAESAVRLNRKPYGRDPDKVDAILDKIVTQTERATDIIQRLREFVRNHKPQAQANEGPALVEEVIEFIEPELRRYGIAIDLSIPEDLRPIWVDRVQIEQVLLNLIHNAMQATAGSSNPVKQLNIQLSDGEDGIDIAVRDYADGVPPADRENLFTPFFTTKRTGLGMGLAISRSIAEAHGGRLTYHAAEPGSVFHLHLPYHVTEP